MAHFTCLAAARHALLRERGWNVERDGLHGAPAIRVLATEHRHGSVERALRFLGIGTGALVPLAPDADARVPTSVLATALKVSNAPAIVVFALAALKLVAFAPLADLLPFPLAA